MLNAMVTLGVIGVVVVFAARVAEPSVRPVLYPVSASPATLVASVAVEVASPVEASQTSSVDTASTTTSVAPVATTLAATTTVPTTSTTTTTTTVAPVDEVAVLTASYAWGRSTDAAVLQQVLGIEADGWYGPATRAAHVAENQARSLPVDAVATAPTTTVPPTTTVAPTPTVPPTTTVAVPTTTVPPPSTTAGMFGNLGAQLMAQLLGQPCIADGDLSDCGPEVDALVRGLVG